MVFDDFRKDVLKVCGKRQHSIKNSIGVRDAFKWCRKNKIFQTQKNVTEKDFYKIIRTVNNIIAQEVINGNDVKLPQRMGQLEVRKYDTYVKLLDGKIKTNRGIDWNATLRLWFEDEDAKENKILLKVEDEEVFKIFYNKMIANYNNKSLYQFKPNRELVIAVKKAGKDGLIDAYKIGND